LDATTERIHIGSGIFNVSPRVNHPVCNAERVAMLDHLTNRRFEFGTGRGAGSHEVGTLNIHDPSSTKAEFNEVIREFVRMWERRDYTFQGEHFSLDVPHNVLPKPYFPGHPAIWVACGNPTHVPGRRRDGDRRSRVHLRLPARHEAVRRELQAGSCRLHRSGWPVQERNI
jgi:alkanesulfonate monooxygenase SsuD/methylene tetrahydromethanopterin reductase-like flavin-dependent oxidoreductase (luciferase family)